MTIPSRLRNNDINFCLVEKPIKGNSASGKKPFQKGWPEKEIKWNDKELNDWISQGGNYGIVAGGDSNLIVLDFDDEEIQKEVIKKLPETFTVKTGSGLLHKYFFSDEAKGFRVKDEEEKTLVDVQGLSTQVVGPGCTHYSGNCYTIEDNSPIATMAMSDIHKLLDKYNKGRKAKKKNLVTPTAAVSIDNFQQELFDSMPFENLMDEFGVDITKNPSNCPFHESKGQKCLGWNEDVANCFNCGDSWNKMSWIKDNLKCTAKEAIEWLAEKRGMTPQLEASRNEWKQQKQKEELDEINRMLSEASGKNPDEEFDDKKINWVDDELEWEELKNPLRKVLQAKDQMFLVAHKNDFVEGKPQLVHSSMKKITLIKKIKKPEKKGKDAEEDDEFDFFHKFLDESHDKRSEGKIINELSLDFWIYRVFYQNREYYLLSENELELSTCKIYGMIMELNDLTEMTSSMKIKSISRLFFVHHSEPNVKILSKDDIVKFTKDRKIGEEDWFKFLNYHPLNTLNKFPLYSTLLRSAHLLSSKTEEWPLHLAIMGPPGTKKSMGYIETIAHKFEDGMEIVEGGNARMKFLSPSFKEKPANVGYLARSERIGFIDELGKMIELQMKIQENASNMLGELNFLLDHKKRTVGSGNDNECIVKASAKNIFVTNPVGKKRYLSEHVGTIDPTTMSRIFWWVQDDDEIEFSLSDKSVEDFEIPGTHTIKGVLPGSSSSRSRAKNSTGKPKKVPTAPTDDIFSCVCVPGFFSSRDEFLTLYDTCNSFLSTIDKTRAITINQTIRNITYEPMKGIWAPRGIHHTILIIDGIVKHRCLFKDYDSSFTAKEEDYDMAEKLLVKMVKNWDTNLGIRKGA